MRKYTYCGYGVGKVLMQHHRATITGRHTVNGGVTETEKQFDRALSAEVFLLLFSFIVCADDNVREIEQFGFSRRYSATCDKYAAIVRTYWIRNNFSRSSDRLQRFTFDHRMEFRVFFILARVWKSTLSTFYTSGIFEGQVFASTFKILSIRCVFKHREFESARNIFHRSTSVCLWSFPYSSFLSSSAILKTYRRAKASIEGDLGEWLIPSIFPNYI